MDCQPAGDRPALPPEYQIDWKTVLSVPQAKREFENYKVALRRREQIVANYLLDTEGKLFQCANDAAWLREREAAM